MSTTNLEHNQLITCDLCQRRYNTNVYQRHRNENQCIKRNQHRLPFESIKQRSIRIGDKTFSVQQQQSQQTKNDQQILSNPETRKPTISHNQQRYQEKIQRIAPTNNRRRTLEQAKQLLERRTRYKPPWIQQRSHFIDDVQSKLNRTNTIILQTKDLSNNAIHSKQSTKVSHDRSSPPTTKFKNDNIPIKISDRRVYNHPVPKQPILTHSPKIPTSHALITSKYQSNRVDQTFPHEQTNSVCRPMRKAYTWTRPSKQPSDRDVISPIHIPTFHEQSSGPSHDRVSIPFNQNYDDDEFERYSPTPSSTPKYQQHDRIQTKNIPASIKQNFIVEDQQTMVRPITYQKAKRSDRHQQHEVLIYPPSSQYARKNTQSIFRLPPINPSSYPKRKQHATINPTPWR